MNTSVKTTFYSSSNFRVNWSSGIVKETTVWMHEVGWSVPLLSCQCINETWWGVSFWLCQTGLAAGSCCGHRLHTCGNCRCFRNVPASSLLLRNWKQSVQMLQHGLFFYISSSIQGNCCSHSKRKQLSLCNSKYLPPCVLHTSLPLTSNLMCQKKAKQSAEWAHGGAERLR